MAADPAERSALPSPRGRKVDWAYVPPRNLDQHSGLREAPEGTSSRRRAESLQAGSSALVPLLPDHYGEVAKSAVELGGVRPD